MGIHRVAIEPQTVGDANSTADDRLFVDAVARADRVVMVELLTGKRLPISDSQGCHVGMIWAEELELKRPGFLGGSNI